jgi:hypothetical protein
MTDRAKALVVHLTDDLRIGDIETGADRLMDAIACLQGVLKVEPLITTTDDYMARVRVMAELRKQLFDMLVDFPESVS